MGPNLSIICFLDIEHLYYNIGFFDILQFNIKEVYLISKKRIYITTVFPSIVEENQKAVKPQKIEPYQWTSWWAFIFITSEQ